MLLAATALVAGLACVLRPEAVLLVIAAAAVVGAMLVRIEWALLAYVAIEPFGDLANLAVPGAVKAVGALLFVAWLARLVIEPRPVALRHAGLGAAGALLVVVLASTAASGGNPPVGMEVAARYLSYLGVLVVVVDTIASPAAAGDTATTLARARRVAAAFVLSCTAAAVVGLLALLGTEGGRAGGPLEDPNDFAFFLLAATPFALLLARGGRTRRLLFGACTALLVTATAATFSRGALLGLAVVLVLGLLLGLVRLRSVALGALVLAVVAGGLLVLSADTAAWVQRSLEEKQHVADANVDSRFASWTIAAEMTADRPLLGHGPGGFGLAALDYAPSWITDTTHLDVAHQMYLDVASELGLLGLAAFGAVLGCGALGAVRARRHGIRAGDGRAPLATAVLCSLGGVLVAACFLSEQYYLPVWLLAGLGIALDPTHTTPSPRRDARCASSS